MSSRAQDRPIPQTYSRPRASDLGSFWEKFLAPEPPPAPTDSSREHSQDLPQSPTTLPKWHMQGQTTTQSPPTQPPLPSFPARPQSFYEERTANFDPSDFWSKSGFLNANSTRSDNIRESNSYVHSVRTNQPIASHNQDKLCTNVAVGGASCFSRFSMVPTPQPQFLTTFNAKTSTTIYLTPQSEQEVGSAPIYDQESTMNGNGKGKPIEQTISACSSSSSSSSLTTTDSAPQHRQSQSLQSLTLENPSSDFFTLFHAYSTLQHHNATASMIPTQSLHRLSNSMSNEELLQQTPTNNSSHTITHSAQPSASEANLKPLPQQRKTNEALLTSQMYKSIPFLSQTVHLKSISPSVRTLLIKHIILPLKYPHIHFRLGITSPPLVILQIPNTSCLPESLSALLQDLKVYQQTISLHSILNNNHTLPTIDPKNAALNPLCLAVQQCMNKGPSVLHLHDVDVISSMLNPANLSQLIQSSSTPELSSTPDLSAIPSNKQAMELMALLRFELHRLDKMSHFRMTLYRQYMTHLSNQHKEHIYPNRVPNTNNGSSQGQALGGSENSTSPSVDRFNRVSATKDKPAQGNGAEQGPQTGQIGLSSPTTAEQIWHSDDAVMTDSITTPSPPIVQQYRKTTTSLKAVVDTGQRGQSSPPQSPSTDRPDSIYTDNIVRNAPPVSRFWDKFLGNDTSSSVSPAVAGPKADSKMEPYTLGTTQATSIPTAATPKFVNTASTQSFVAIADSMADTDHTPVDSSEEPFTIESGLAPKPKMCKDTLELSKKLRTDQNRYLEQYHMFSDPHVEGKVQQSGRKSMITSTSASQVTQIAPSQSKNPSTKAIPHPVPLWYTMDGNSPVTCKYPDNLKHLQPHSYFPTMLTPPSFHPVVVILYTNSNHRGNIELEPEVAQPKNALEPNQILEPTSPSSQHDTNSLIPQRKPKTPSVQTYVDQYFPNLDSAPFLPKLLLHSYPKPIQLTIPLPNLSTLIEILPTYLGKLLLHPYFFTPELSNTKSPSLLAKSRPGDTKPMENAPAIITTLSFATCTKNTQVLPPAPLTLNPTLLQYLAMQVIGFDSLSIQWMCNEAGRIAIHRTLTQADSSYSISIPQSLFSNRQTNSSSDDSDGVEIPILTFLEDFYTYIDSKITLSHSSLTNRSGNRNTDFSIGNVGLTDRRVNHSATIVSWLNSLLIQSVQDQASSVRNILSTDSPHMKPGGRTSSTEMQSALNHVISNTLPTILTTLVITIEDILDAIQVTKKVCAIQTPVLPLSQMIEFTNAKNLFTHESLLQSTYDYYQQQLQGGITNQEQEQHAMIDSTRESEAIRVVAESPSSEIEAMFPSVIGHHHAKQVLYQSLLLPLQFPDLYQYFSMTLSTGVLLYGVPGCGKTLFAKSLAGNHGTFSTTHNQSHQSMHNNKTNLTQAYLAQRPFQFFTASCSDLLSAYVGESEKRLVQLFKQSQKAAPSILFFDEIDAIAKKRSGNGSGSDSDAMNRFVSTFLMLFDTMQSSSSTSKLPLSKKSSHAGSKPQSPTLIIGATNFPSLVDPALLRPGRFEHLIYIGLPDFWSRIELLLMLFGLTVEPISNPTPSIASATLRGTNGQHYQLSPKHGENVMCDLNTITLPFLCQQSSLTRGFSSAEIEYIVNTAKQRAIRRTVARSRGGLQKSELSLVSAQDILHLTTTRHNSLFCPSSSSHSNNPTILTIASLMKFKYSNNANTTSLSNDQSFMNPKSPIDLMQANSTPSLSHRCEANASVPTSCDLDVESLTKLGYSPFTQLFCTSISEQETFRAQLNTRLQQNAEGFHLVNYIDNSVDFPEDTELSLLIQQQMFYSPIDLHHQASAIQQRLMASQTQDQDQDQGRKPPAVNGESTAQSLVERLIAMKDGSETPQQTTPTEATDIDAIAEQASDATTIRTDSNTNASPAALQQSSNNTNTKQEQLEALQQQLIVRTKGIPIFIPSEWRSSAHQSKSSPQSGLVDGVDYVNIPHLHQLFWKLSQSQTESGSRSLCEQLSTMHDAVQGDHGDGVARKWVHPLSSMQYFPDLSTQ